MAKERVSIKDKSLTDISRKKNSKDYIDIDQTILEPSPQRIRNILTLEERVAAIEAYDCRPMYTKVAKMFNCSWEQIKNIVVNRDAIMEFYMATRSVETQNDPNRLEVRSRKISFLGECLYEYIQRAQFHKKANITEDLLRMKAIEFRDIIQIDNLMPNKAWINHFKATYNFSLSNRQITITRTPPASLDLKDIMTYCTMNKTKVKGSLATSAIENKNRNDTELYRTATRIAVSGENEAASQEMKQRRLRKLNFLIKALFEYSNRAKYHQKMRMNEISLRKVACELKEMLKIENFYPDKEWLNHFITVTYPTMLEESTDTRPPPLSLDLKDILSYCSRQENKKNASSTITLAPKEIIPATNVVSPTIATPLVQIHTFNLRRSDETNTTRSPQITETCVNQAVPVPCKIKEEVIELDVVGNKATNEERDVKPSLSELLPKAIFEAVQPRSDETQKKPLATTTKTLPRLMSKRQQQCKALDKTMSAPTTATCTGRDNIGPFPALRVVSLSDLVPPLQPLTPITTPAIAKDTLTTLATVTVAEPIIRTETPKATTTIPSVRLKRAAASNETSLSNQPMKIQKVQSICKQIEQTVHSPGHWSEHSDCDEEELPKHVTNYKDALKLLKPLEEFAMLEENYRVIGLISQLEEIFKHPPNKEDNN